MKKLLIPFIALACCLSCTNSHDGTYTHAKELPDTTVSIALHPRLGCVQMYNVENNGHIYLVTVFNEYSASTIHAEHCSCKNQKSNN